MVLMNPKIFEAMKEHAEGTICGAYDAGSNLVYAAKEGTELILLGVSDVHTQADIDADLALG